MFNLLPGGGLGFSGSKEIAFGLGAVVVSEIPVVPPVLPIVGGGGGGGGGGWGKRFPINFIVHDNAYSVGDDDNEILLILTTTFPQVIE